MTRVLMKISALPTWIPTVGCFCFTTDCGFELLSIGSDDSQNESSSSSSSDDDDNDEVTADVKQPEANPSSSNDGG